MVDAVVNVAAVLEAAGLTNRHVQEFVEHWAGVTGASSVQVVSAADDERLVAEALEAGELVPAGEGRYYARSYVKDTARAEERTIVATGDERDRGTYNNWRPGAETKEKLVELMTGASAGRTMYVIPYLMAPAGSPLDRYAAGVELTDNRGVVLQMIRMSRVGADNVNDLGDDFVRGVHVTGDLANLGQGTPDDKRHFVTLADERTILHFGSSYGGNALLGKIAHGLRQGSYDGWKNGFLVEQFMLLGITDRQTGRKYNIAGGFPSASGKTNLAMTLAPEALGDRYYVEFYGDDIAWIWVDEDGVLRGFNPENGVFGVAKDTNERTNPTAIDSIVPGSGAIFTNVAYNERTQDVWWEGRGDKPTDLDGWLDWKGERIADRAPEHADDPWAHPNSRFTTQLANVPNVAKDWDDPRGVEIHGIIFGGRTRDREPLIRAITDVAEGVYDGLTLGAEATAAADGLEGVLRYDPMSMRPFLSYPEADYAQHWLDVIGQARNQPIFAHVNWFQRDAEGRFIWPGYRENLRPLVWLMRLRSGEVTGVPSPVGILPARDELDLAGLDERTLADLDTLLTIDVERWRQEIGYREEHLAQFDGLPEPIWAAHRRVAAALDAERESVGQS
ncbi:phosphoenolpyruvate carboxykinase (GTP) [Nocardioides iriomotensis]|uniref:Phosphoenolpyruvate carboxykinase [GTP] n=1 Tax=Nocardioides iriomotensis TaxID=715784 RepID=A0A4Q5J157_9ACTN|nr:phosphoenolpyruvate carboxykinase (GTP) [Nocardioides iriomotensis]RYU12257.1 phosphoenolpyruvate carboxykinase (GTP) [Nocardioides iriomotensis]